MTIEQRYAETTKNYPWNPEEGMERTAAAIYFTQVNFPAIDESELERLIAYAVRVWNTKPQRKRVVLMATCKHCKKTSRWETIRTWYRGGFLPPSDEQKHKKCDCGRENAGEALKITIHKETRCNSACTCATGPICVCSCGGENHGSAYGANTLQF